MRRLSRSGLAFRWRPSVEERVLRSGRDRVGVHWLQMGLLERVDGVVGRRHGKMW